MGYHSKASSRQRAPHEERPSYGVSERQDLYGQVTNRIIAELEEGRLPWVQPWDSAEASTGLPRNASTGRAYSGINILILWAAVIDGRYSRQTWLTYKQCLALGGHVRKGAQGTSICYADRFIPKAEQARAAEQKVDARQVVFLRRFTVFNIDQCEGLPTPLAGHVEPLLACDILPHADALIDATGADFRIGGDRAFYVPSADFIAVPPPQAYHYPIDWYRTAFHELGHWSGHASRLDRDLGSANGDAWYAREELVAEMTSAFVCAELAIKPSVRHADYIGSWLEVLRNDPRAIFRAASQASKAADYLLACRPTHAHDAGDPA